MTGRIDIGKEHEPSGDTRLGNVIKIVLEWSELITSTKGTSGALLQLNVARMSNRKKAKALSHVVHDLEGRG